MQGVTEQISLDEVEEIYLPLSRLLNLYVAATQELHRATDTFLRARTAKVPFVIGVAGSVAVGKSTTSRLLQALLSRWPDHPEVALVTTDGFLHPNAELERRGLLERKGFPESYDTAALVRFVADVKAGEPEVSAPVYSHLRYDVLPDERVTVRQPDVLIVEGINVLQTGSPPTSAACSSPTSSTSRSTSTPTRRTSSLVRRALPHAAPHGVPRPALLLPALRRPLRRGGRRGRPRHLEADQRREPAAQRPAHPVPCRPDPAQGRRPHGRGRAPAQAVGPRSRSTSSPHPVTVLSISRYLPRVGASRVPTSPLPVISRPTVSAPPSPPRGFGPRETVLLLTLASMWGLSFLFIEVALRGLGPMWIVVGRTGVGAAGAADGAAPARTPPARQRAPVGPGPDPRHHDQRRALERGGVGPAVPALRPRRTAHGRRADLDAAGVGRDRPRAVHPREAGRAGPGPLRRGRDRRRRRDRPRPPRGDGRDRRGHDDVRLGRRLRQPAGLRQRLGADDRHRQVLTAFLVTVPVALLLDPLPPPALTPRCSAR
jgi:hypothetical protein